MEMKKKLKKSVSAFASDECQELRLFAFFLHAVDIFLNTAERFLLVCSSMAAGCSRTPEVK